MLAELLTYRTEVPQEGRIREQTGEIEMRVSTFPTLHGERAVVRLFASQQSFQFLRELGLPTEIEAALERCTQYDEDCPAQLAQAIRHSLLAPGKRLRPLLVLMAAEAGGSGRGPAMPAACATCKVRLIPRRAETGHWAISRALARVFRGPSELSLAASSTVPE